MIDTPLNKAVRVALVGVLLALVAVLYTATEARRIVVDRYTFDPPGSGRLVLYVCVTPPVGTTVDFDVRFDGRPLPGLSLSNITHTGACKIMHYQGCLRTPFEATVTVVDPYPANVFRPQIAYLLYKFKESRTMSGHDRDCSP